MGNSAKSNSVTISASRLGAVGVLGLVIGSGCLSPSRVVTNNNAGYLTSIPMPSPSASVSPLPTVSASPTVAPVAMAPSTAQVAVGQTMLIAGTGGIPPYTYAVAAGIGTIDATGLFHAGYQPGNSTVQVADSTGAVSTGIFSVVIAAAPTPNDPSYSADFTNSVQWPLLTGAINAQSAWGFTKDCRSVTVAIIDTGIDTQHEDLKNNLWTNPGEGVTADNTDQDNDRIIDDIHGASFAGANWTGHVDDDHFHGTHVAGIIGAEGNNGLGITGVCWRASLMAIKAFDQNGNGATSDVVNAVDYAVLKGARIINMSFAFTDNSQALSAAIDRANAAGVLIVTAAGNGSNNNDVTPVYPAAYTQTNILTVASHDKPQYAGAVPALSDFSNYGPNSVQISAPGKSIFSTTPTHATAAMGAANPPVAFQYGTLSGTSQATAFVTGSAALLWSFYPQSSMVDIRARLLQQPNYDQVAAYINPNNGATSTIVNMRRLNVRAAIYQRSP